MRPGYLIPNIPIYRKGTEDNRNTSSELWSRKFYQCDLLSGPDRENLSLCKNRHFILFLKNHIPFRGNRDAGKMSIMPLIINGRT